MPPVIITAAPTASTVDVTFICQLRNSRLQRYRWFLKGVPALNDKRSVRGKLSINPSSGLKRQQDRLTMKTRLPLRTLQGGFYSTRYISNPGGCSGGLQSTPECNEA